MSIAQDIYNVFIQAGMTKEGALGTEANLKAESGLEANRLEGDFNPFRTVSKSFVQRCENGSVSRQDFAYMGRGFGLAQWTYHTRLFGLWDFWKKTGGKLDDPIMQANFVVHELKEDHRSLWETLCNSHELYTCTKLVCTEYERPAVNNIDARYRIAIQLRDDLDVKTGDGQEPSKDIYWPPRMLCKGMTGDDVAVLQALLIAHGYPCESISGQFDVSTRNMTIAYQSQNALDQDGIVGPKTWASLLRMG